MMNWNSDRLYISDASFLLDLSELERLNADLSKVAAQLSASDANMPNQLAERIAEVFSDSQELANALEAYDALFLYRGVVSPLDAARSQRSRLHILLDDQQKLLTEIAVYCLKHGGTALLELHCFLRMFRCPEHESLFSEYAALRSSLHSRTPADGETEAALARCLCKVKACTFREAVRAGFRSPLEAGLFGTGLCGEDVDTVFEQIARSVSPLNREIAACLRTNTSISKTAFSKTDAEALIRAALSPLSPRIGQLLDSAFSENWIDWEPAPGKLSGARHFRIIRLRESRILLNFTGCLDDIFALAHELGHAWQANCMMTGADASAAEYGAGIKELGAYVFEQLVGSYLMQHADRGMQTELQMRTLRNDLKLLCEVPVRYHLEKMLYSAVQQGRQLSAESITAAAEGLIASAGAAGLPDFAAADGRFWTVTSALYATNDCFYNYEYTFCFLESLAVCRHLNAGGNEAVQHFERILGASAGMNIMDIYRIYSIDGCEFFAAETAMAVQRLRGVLAS